MAHYPIKCVYCFQEISNEDVLFNLGDRQLTGISARRTDRGTPGAAGPAAAPPRREEPNFVLLENKDDFFEDAEAPDEEPSGPERNPLGADFFTAAQLRELMPDSDVSLKNTPVAVTPEFHAERAAGEKDLFTEVEYTDKNGNRMALCHRYCPYCGSRLPSLSGRVPTYLVTVLGTSSSGKTVYLAALHQLLKNGQKKMQLHRGQLNGDAAENDMLIAELSKELYSHGVLPSTTLDSVPDPVSFHLTFSLEMKAGNLAPQKACILALADMKGEDLTDAKAEALVMLHEKYRISDAFLFMVDPENMPGYFSAAGEAQELPEAHSKLTHLVRDHIASQFGGSVDKPAVVVMTKTDKLLALSRRYPGQELFRRVSRTLDPETTSRMSKSQDYFKRLGLETQAILEAYDPNMRFFLQNTFPNAVYANVAAMGPAPDFYTEDGQLKIRDPNVELAIRLEDPLLILLSKLHFVPPYETMPAVRRELPLPGRLDPRRKETEQWNRRAREDNQRFRDIVNAWRRDYTLTAPPGGAPQSGKPT